MVRGPLVGSGELEQPAVVPHAAEERNPHRVAAADESGRDGDLRQAGRRALFARARLEP